jgi:protein-disulfide isomerase
MGRKHGWLIVLVSLALLVAACGPQMATPTPNQDVAEASPTAAMAPVKKTATAVQEDEPTTEPVSSADLPVDEDDWHVLGSPDAPVTIIEYSDFQ